METRFSGFQEVGLVAMKCRSSQHAGKQQVNESRSDLRKLASHEVAGVGQTSIRAESTVEDTGNSVVPSGRVNLPNRPDTSCLANVHLSLSGQIFGLRAIAGWL